MIRSEFARRLQEASDRCLVFAREFIVNSVPDERRFDILIKPHGPDHEGPIVDPLLMDLWTGSGRRPVREQTADQVLAALWHDGRVPEWIDISLDAIEAPGDDPWRAVSIVELRCSRTLVDDDGLWYANEGVPPFHILGPTLPRDWDERRPEGRRFVLPSRKKR